jgi:pimeloyl-ACP methyl ester carboxylesterase
MKLELALLKALVGVAISISFGATTTLAAKPFRFPGAPCEKPPILHCPETGCRGNITSDGGPVVEPKTGRKYFLDYPCDLKAGEKVTLVLSLHGAGAPGNWQRHYFPIFDYKDQNRLVIATPFSPTRTWSAADDEYLQNIVTSVIDQLGKNNIKAFWLAGHSQGGATSNRLVCTDFFKTKVDGFLSLSGGRVGGSPQRGSNFGNLAPRGNARGGATPAPAAARGAGPRGGGTAALPACEFSHLYETGEHEMANDLAGLPKNSTWAEKYSCGPQQKRPDVVDTKAGYVYDGSRQNPGSAGWGLLPRPGTAQVFVYPKCKDGRVVADIVRLDKGHTEGLEPNVTAEIVKLMLSAQGGKVQREK